MKDQEELEADREDREAEERNHIEDIYYEMGMEPPEDPSKKKN